MDIAPDRITGKSYFGDIRDRLDELYETSASFVQIYDPNEVRGKAIVIASDLVSSAHSDYYKTICYYYEDSYSWEDLPLYIDSSACIGVIRWIQDGRLLIEQSFSEGTKNFSKNTDVLKLA